MPTAPRTEVTVVGLVVGPSSEPLPWTSLFFEPDEPALERYQGASTDSTGAYSVRLLSGRYRVQIEPPAGRGLMPRTEQVTVSSGHHRADFVFRGYHVTGTVIDPTGSVLDSGWVNAYMPGEGYTSSLLQEGKYSLTLPAGRLSLTAVPANYWSGFSTSRQESIPIDADTTIDIHLGGILISGTVLGPDGLPMSDAGVEAQGDHFNTSRNKTSVGGGYRLYVPPGQYRVWFRPPYPFYIIPRIVGPMTISVPISIDCQLSGIEWTGTVRRSGTNDPAPGITVLVQMIDDADRRGAAIYTDAQGDFRFIVEADRRYDLSAYDPVSRAEVARVGRVTATADTTFEILIPSASSATVRP